MKKARTLFVILLCAGLVLGALCWGSARMMQQRITQAIEAIGDVSYSEETRRLLDAEDAALSSADPNLHLEEKIPNLGTLKEAKLEYVKLAIKELYISIRDKEAEEIIRERLADAEDPEAAAIDTEEDAPLLKNYADLESAREKYGPDAGAAPAATPAPQPAAAAVPELCPT